MPISIYDKRSRDYRHRINSQYGNKTIFMTAIKMDLDFSIVYNVLPPTACAGE